MGDAQLKLEISASILSADFGKLNEDIAEVEKYVDRIHVDVMDGHFVPNISFGAPVMKWIKSPLRKDVHLMIEFPWKYFDDFIKAGADSIIIHSEVCDAENNLEKVLRTLKEKGVKTGVSIKPKTPVSEIGPYLDLIDHVLIMTVEPGFGGQEFMADMVPKISELRELGFKGDISVDGGINAETSKICVEAGANVLVAGSYIFGHENRQERINSLK